MDRRGSSQTSARARCGLGRGPRREHMEIFIAKRGGFVEKSQIQGDQAVLSLSECNERGPQEGRLYLRVLPEQPYRAC
jgi:hypothetical protein